LLIIDGRYPVDNTRKNIVLEEKLIKMNQALQR